MFALLVLVESPWQNPPPTAAVGYAGIPLYQGGERKYSHIREKCPIVILSKVKNLWCKTLRSCFGSQTFFNLYYYKYWFFPSLGKGGCQRQQRWRLTGGIPYPDGGGFRSFFIHLSIDKNSFLYYNSL